MTPGILVMTNGVFDVLHDGHRHLLREAKKHGDFLLVAVNDDASVAALKGVGRPVQSVADRVSALRAVPDVDAVIRFSGTTPKRCIEIFRPDVLVKGDDYAYEDVVGREYAGQVVLVPRLPGVSTTEAIARG